MAALRLALVVLLVSACATQNASTLPIMPVPSPAGFYKAIAWVEGGLITAYDPNPQELAWKDQLIWLRPTEGEWLAERLLPSFSHSCTRTSYGPLSRLPDGRVGYVLTCD